MDADKVALRRRMDNENTELCSVYTTQDYRAVKEDEILLFEEKMDGTRKNVLSGATVPHKHEYAWVHSYSLS